MPDETFTPIPDWLARNQALSWPQKALWARIRRYGTCWASSATLARELGLSARQVRRDKGQLIAWGWLQVVQADDQRRKPKRLRAVIPGA